MVKHRKERRQGDSFTIPIFIILIVGLLFSFLFTPFQGVQSLLFYILLVASLLPLLLLEGKRSGSLLYKVKGVQDFFNDYALGVVAGVFIIFFVFLVLQGRAALYNIFGTISAGSISPISFGQELLIIYVAPIAELLLLVAIQRVTAAFFRTNLVGFLITMVLFSLFHFFALGIANYPVTPQGFWDFLTQPAGGFTQVVLGLGLLILYVVFESWILIWVAHMIYNAFVVGSVWTGFLDPFVAGVLLFSFGVLAFVVAKNGLSELGTAKPMNIITYERL